MKKTLLAILVLMMCAFTVNAQPLLEENFNYTAGDTLGSYWVYHSGTVGQLFITSGGLSYTGYASSGIGNAVQLQTSESEDMHKDLPSALTSGNVYASFLVNVSSVNTSGDYFFHFGESPFSTSNIRGRVAVKRDASNNLAFGLSKSSSAASATYTSFSYTYDTTYLMVLKYTIVAGLTNDSVSLFIFQQPTSVPSEEPATPTLGPNVDVASTDLLNIGAVCVRQGATSNRPTLKLDGLRVDTSWNQAPLPVELTSFTAIAKGKGVELAWQTATEVNNYGFEVERKAESVNGRNSEWAKIGFVAGSGNSNSPKSYNFTDASAKGNVVYRLKQIDNDGAFEYHGMVEVNASGAITKHALMQNYPNPFNPTTEISYQLPASGFVSLKVYDMLGKEIATLVNGVQEAGEQQATFTASKYPSGMYFYTLRTGSFVETKKMLLVK